jgi:hypothetical protein
LGKVKSEKDRLRKAIEIARTLPVSDLRSWINSGRFDFSRGAARTIFEKIVYDRWIKEAPADFLEWAMTGGDPSYQRFLKRIAESDREGFAKLVDDAGAKGRGDQLLNSLANVDPGLAFDEVKRILLQPKGARFGISRVLERLMKTHVDDLAKLLEASPEPPNWNLASVVYSHQLKEDFKGTFAQLLDFPRGLEILKARNLMKAEQFEAYVNQFPPTWKKEFARNPTQFSHLFGGLGEMDWESAGFSQEQAISIRSAIVRNESYRNPERALSLVEKYQVNDHQKRMSFSQIISRAKSPEQVNQLAERISDADDRALFLEISERISESAAAKPAKVSPVPNQEDLLAALARNERPDLSRSLRSWDEQQLEKLVGDFGDFNEGEKTALAEMIKARSYGVPGELQTAALVHLASRVEGLEGYEKASHQRSIWKHALDLLSRDPDEASAYVNRLPKGELQLQAKKNLAINWRNYDPSAAQNWINLQSPQDRKAIEEFLESK